MKKNPETALSRDEMLEQGMARTTKATKKLTLTNKILAGVCILLVLGIAIDRVNDSRTLKAYKVLQEENHTLVVANNKLIEDVARVERLVIDASTLTAESRDAAVGTLQELRIALQRASNNELDPSIKEALATIGRIEIYLCGGTCD